MQFLEDKEMINHLSKLTPAVRLIRTAPFRVNSLFRSPPVLGLGLTRPRGAPQRVVETLCGVRSSEHSPTRQPPERRIGFRYGKNSPLLAHFVHNSPPLFASTRLRGGIFLTQVILLKIPPRAHCYAPPVFHTWGTRVGFACTSWFCFAKLLRSVGRGVRRPALNCLMVNNGQVFTRNFFLRSLNKKGAKRI